MPGGLRCAVARCKNSSLRNSRLPPEEYIYFHRFPRNKKTAKIWVEQCHRNDEFNIQNARMCSEHFTNEDYQRDLKNELLGLPVKKRLKSDAIPTLKLLSEDTQTSYPTPPNSEIDVKLNFRKLIQECKVLAQENEELEKLLHQTNELLNVYKAKVKTLEQGVDNITSVFNIGHIDLRKVNGETAEDVTNFH